MFKYSNESLTRKCEHKVTQGLPFVSLRSYQKDLINKSPILSKVCTQCFLLYRFIDALLQISTSHTFINVNLMFLQNCTPIDYIHFFAKTLTAMNPIFLTFSLYLFSSLVVILVVIANVLAELWWFCQWHLCLFKPYIFGFP